MYNSMYCKIRRSYYNTTKGANEQLIILEERYIYTVHVYSITTSKVKACTVHCKHMSECFIKAYMLYIPVQYYSMNIVSYMA